MKKFMTLVLTFAICLSISVPAYAKASNFGDFSENETQVNAAVQKLVYEYAQSASNNDIGSYIALFTSENQKSMMEYIDEVGEHDFFREKSIEIVDITVLSEDTGLKSAGVSPTEKADYQDIRVCYVEMAIDTVDEYKVFVLAAEKGSWKILRVSVPDFRAIDEASEGFGSYAEQQLLTEQEEMKTELLVAGENQANPISAPTADPTEITVYFKKSANKNYYGVAKKTLGWNTYLKNVIPKEWYVSYYASYPEYLRAGAMASKMYAWWYIVHPKWDFSPYYADVVDDSNDQNFLYSAYDDMELNAYRDYVDEVLSWIKNIAMCDDEGNMFEVHYHATKGTQYSGQMSASGAYTLAKAGKSMLQILCYYYNYSDYIGSKHTVQLWGYVG